MLALLQTEIPDTTAYLLLGLAAIAIIMTGLIGSMILRYRSLQKDLQVIQQLADEDKS